MVKTLGDGFFQLFAVGDVNFSSAGLHLQATRWRFTHSERRGARLSRRQASCIGDQATSPWPTDLRVGSSIAGYRIDAIIARGGMGIVYEACELAFDRRVALKVIAPPLADNPTYRCRFERELRITMSLPLSITCAR
jgi:serine/threonine protein kinase